MELLTALAIVNLKDIHLLKSKLSHRYNVSLCNTSLYVYVVNFFILLGNTSPHLLTEFPDPKGLLNNAISRSLGVGDLSQYIQYSCTEQAGVKVRTKILPSWQIEDMAKSIQAKFLFYMTSFYAESYCQSTLALQF